MVALSVTEAVHRQFKSICGHGGHHKNKHIMIQSAGKDWVLLFHRLIKQLVSVSSLRQIKSRTEYRT